ncbi:unnamed protein product [Nezara viridula]|uniref:FAD-binding PCMH-type domain-containing protein n=1 Tax=Nezara viridula TaxID=85310 RepID=A0A9P0MT58_NEZVI|nr:unnamed protein product [Nezara viridula]
MGFGWSKNNKNILQDEEGRPFGKEAEFTINGKTQSVSGQDILPTMPLVNFIRERTNLMGTKFMCREGVCGACIVSVTSIHPATGKPNTFAVNSCLIPVLACHGWSISTVEDLGSRTLGYHKIIKRLAAANGSQCGYCSPGMVMNMYSLLEKNPKMTMKDVENSFGGNICRCTGYRPILDAFKSFTSDCSASLQTKLADMEDLMDESKYCSKEKYHANKRTPKPYVNRLQFDLKEGGTFWFRPDQLKEVFQILDMIGIKHYRFISGNTGQGIYHIRIEPEVYIDLNAVPELHAVSTTPEGISMGASVNLTEAMEFFYKMAYEQPAKFEYLKALADHFDMIANIPVRNTGTLGGNLYMKHSNHDFSSDIFILLEMVNAELVIADFYGEKITVGLLDFLKTDMNRKIIITILLPNLDNRTYYVRTFKIMPRAQSAHNYVNAGFMCKMDKKSYNILEKPNLVFGGIKPDFIHAKNTEEYLTGKTLIDPNVLKEALNILELELEPDHILPDASPEYRKGLALSLFYKFVLSVAPDKVKKDYQSGGPLLERPVSQSKQTFDTESSVWPLSRPVPKIESIIQCSGEARYANDLPNIPGQLWAQLILADRGGAVIIKVDTEEALKIEGVVAFYKAEDIPGVNDYYPATMILVKDDRELLTGFKWQLDLSCFKFVFPCRAIT